MALGISREKIELAWDNCLDIAFFTGIGYLCGRAVNWYIHWASKPSFFGKAEMINVKSVAICCGLFMAIERIAQHVLSSYLNTQKSKEDSEYEDGEYNVKVAKGKKEKGYVMKLTKSEEYSKYMITPFYVASRIAVDLTAAIGIFRVLAPRLNLVSIEFEVASAMILMAVVAHNLIILQLYFFAYH
jgi:hypothetical protein